MDETKHDVLEEAQIAAELVRRIKGGDAAAEAELVERYSAGLVFMLRRIAKDAALADDIHQETFRVVLLRLRASGLEEPEKLSGFIRATARNLFIGDYRKRVRRNTGNEEGELARTPDPAPSQLSLVLAGERARLVRQLIGELSTDRDRQVLLRFYVAEEDKEQICADLGLSSLHFNRVLFRARQRFKDLVTRLASSRHQEVAG